MSAMAGACMERLGLPALDKRTCAVGKRAGTFRQVASADTSEDAVAGAASMSEATMAGAMSAGAGA